MGLSEIIRRFTLPGVNAGSKVSKPRERGSRPRNADRVAAVLFALAVKGALSLLANSEQRQELSLCWPNKVRWI